MTYSIEKRATEGGHYNHVEREDWQPVTAQTHVVVPVAEQVIISFSLALFVFVAGIIAGVVLRYSGIPNIGRVMFWAAVWVGVVVGVFDFQRAIAARFSVARDTLVKRELMTRESRKGTATSTVNINLWTKAGSDESPYGRVVYDQLNVSRETLVIACGAARLSKSGLRAVGLSGDVSLPLLTQLLEKGYIARDKKNEPAEWTAKGAALKNALAPPLDMEE